MKFRFIHETERSLSYTLNPFQYVSIYAAYLYDAVKLYARALDQLIRDYPDLSVEELARNGTLITEMILKKSSTYQSMYNSIR